MDPAKLKVVELRAELSKRGLDSKGNKPVLVERLRLALEEEKADPKPQTEATVKLDQSDSEDEGSNTESKSPEPAKLPPRTPSRSSRHASREPSTPARTPTRRSSSRSSLSRQSPAKTTIGESINEAVSTLEPIVEDEVEKKEDEVVVKETLPLTPEKEEVLLVTPKKDPTPATTPKKETIPFTLSTDSVAESPKEEVTPTIIVAKEVITSPKTDNIIKNEMLKLDENDELDIVKEAEKLVPEKSHEITRRSVDEIFKINAQSPIKSAAQCLIKSVTQSPEKLVAQSPTKSEDQSPVKLDPLSPTKVSVQSPIKPSSESPDKYASECPLKPTVQSPVKSATQNLATSPPQSPLKADTSSPVKSVSQSPTKYASPQKGEQISSKDTTESPCKKSDTTEPMQIDKTTIEQESLEKTDGSVKSLDESTDQVNDGQNMDTEDQDDRSEKSDDRKRKRSPSPREEAPRAPPIARPENEPNFDESAVLLSWYDADMNLVIDTTQYFSASPMQGDGFNYMWAGVRASYGFTKGKIFYEARVNSRFDNVITPAPPAPNSTNTSGALPADEEKVPSALRLGWSTLGTSLQLGEEKLSYGYESTGKKATNKEFVEYGKTFAKDDVVGCYADFETDGDVTLTYTVNGETQGPAFVIKKEELENKALFPHVLSRNCSFTVNLGQEDNWNDNILNGYINVGKVDLNDRIVGPRRPEKREDCEVILLVGLPFSGKTAWVRKHLMENPDKYYSVLGTSDMIDKMTIDGVPLKESYKGRWETLVDKCSRALTKLLDSAPSRRRNYILDQQANVYGSAQKRKTRNFYGFHRKAVVLVPTDEEFKARIAKRKEEPDGEEIRESSILEVKANFSAPTVGDSFEEVIWGELGEEEGKKLIEAYNTEGKKSGYGQSLQQPSKRSRFDNGQKDRNSRDNRGHRRSSTYNDRRNSSSSSAWRGGGSGGGSSGGGGSGGGGGAWRDAGRMRGGPMRHGAMYGVPGGWRGRGGVPPQRSGVSDRRQGNDRNRPSGAHRPPGWSPMRYPGSQHASTGVWSNQSWQSQSQAFWSGQQGASSAWSQQQQQAYSRPGNSWKSYGQNSYGQSAGGGYGQQTGSDYGNGNWSNSGPQYYNQYWDGSGQQQQQQQQQTGGQTQTTTGSGGVSGSQSASKK